MKLLKKQKQLQQILMENSVSKTKKLCILFVFFLTTIALLIAVSIYCYLIKYKSKEKHLLPYCVANDKSINVL